MLSFSRFVTFPPPSFSRFVTFPPYFFSRFVTFPPRALCARVVQEYSNNIISNKAKIFSRVVARLKIKHC